MGSFTLVGLDDAAVDYLEGGTDLCFGKYYAKTVFECINCRAPAILEGRIVLLKEICAMKTAGTSSPLKLKKLNSQQVMERLEKGESLSSIFKEILGSAPPGQAAAAARQLLVDRLSYLKTVGFAAPEVPRTKELLAPEVK